MKLLGKNSEKEVINQLKAGDEHAFQLVFEQYKDAVYGYSYMLTKSKVLAEDMVQEVFMKVWKNRCQLDNECSFKSFIYTVTRHQVYNLLRKAAYDEKLKSRIFYQQNHSHQHTEDQVRYAELEHLKNKAISSLPPQRQLIFRMSRMQGLSHYEIAHQLGLSKNTIKDQIVKATKAIKEYLRLHDDIVISIIIFIIFLLPTVH